MSRPHIHDYFMSMAVLVSTLGTCARRKVGAVLVNKHNHVIATGYNGVASGMRHCIEHHCPGAKHPSGQGLDDCEALHAEQNALLQCRDAYEIDTAYVTASPCVTCIKLLLNTSCIYVIFSERYPGFEKVKELWERPLINYKAETASATGRHMIQVHHKIAEHG